MRASPEAHNAYVSLVDNSLGKKVKPLVRFLKAWKYYRSVSISSFYLELRVTKYATSEKSIIYAIDVKNIFRYLLDANLAAMQDPVGVSGYIQPCSTSLQRTDALSKISTAYRRAQKAWEAEDSGDIRGAFYWWDLVFDGRFPAYG